MKVKKGWITVQVGPENEDIDDIIGCQRFVIPITYLYHPFFMGLLDKAREVYGYHTDGPLRLPCSVDHFLDLRWRLEKETLSHRRHHNQHQYVVGHALSFNSC